MVTVVSISYMLSQRLCRLLKLRNEDDPKGTTTGAPDRAQAVELAEKRREMRSRDYGSDVTARSLLLKSSVVVLPVVSALLIARLLNRR